MREKLAELLSGKVLNPGKKGNTLFWQPDGRKLPRYLDQRR
jgi:hypothetical protein